MDYNQVFSLLLSSAALVVFKSLRANKLNIIKAEIKGLVCLFLCSIDWSVGGFYTCKSNLFQSRLGQQHMLPWRCTSVRSELAFVAQKTQS